MIVIGTGLVESYFASHAGHKGIKAARSQYAAWIEIVSSAQWRTAQSDLDTHQHIGLALAGNRFRLAADGAGPRARRGGIRLLRQSCSGAD